MIALSNTRQLSVVMAAAVALLATTLVAAPAQAAPDAAVPTKVSYVALGDSYAAGVGGGDYVGSCVTSPNGYAALLTGDPGQVHTDLRGCIGATTDVVQATQLADLDGRTKTVTLTVGANDLHVAEIALTCLGGTSEECIAALLTAQAALGQLSADLTTTLAAIRYVAPRATVYVTGYPLLFDQPTDPRLVAANSGVELLNTAIMTSVTAAGTGFVYVDVTQAFAGHGIGSIDEWILSPPNLAAFHPNAAGYAAYADALRAAGFSPAMR